MKWEYKMHKEDSVSINENRIDELLNEYGADNWELVSMTNYLNSDINSHPKIYEILFIFKRPSN